MSLHEGRLETPPPVLLKLAHAATGSSCVGQQRGIKRAQWTRSPARGRQTNATVPSASARGVHTEAGQTLARPLSGGVRAPGWRRGIAATASALLAACRTVPGPRLYANGAYRNVAASSCARAAAAAAASRPTASRDSSAMRWAPITCWHVSRSAECAWRSSG